MTVAVPLLFSPVALGTSIATIGTIPATAYNGVYSGGRVRFTNTTPIARAVTLYAVPAGQNATPDNCQMAAETLAGNAHVDVDIPKLAGGGMIMAFADAANSVTISEIAGVILS